MAEMAELDKREKEAARKEVEAVHDAEATWLAAEKAARKATKQGKKWAVEESGANMGAEGPKRKKRVKTIKTGDNNKSPLEATEVSCKR